MTEKILCHLEDPKFNVDLISNAKKIYNNLSQDKKNNCDKIITIGSFILVAVVAGYINFGK